MNIQIILSILLGAISVGMLIVWVKISYYPYREGKITVIMYGERFFTALIGVSGKKTIRWNGKVVNTNKAKGMLWGLIPGEFFPWPFFHQKKDIKMLFTEKKHPSGVDPKKEKVLFSTENVAITFREVITDYLLYQNTYYFIFGDLETGNDLLLENGVKKMEHLDIVLVLGDKIQITNVRDYIFREDNWFTPKENAFHSCVREITASASYKKLQQTKTESLSLKIGDELLMDHMNNQAERYNLGNKSIDINISEIQLGTKSAEYDKQLRKRASSTLLVDIAKNEADAAIEKLRANKEALEAIQKYELALKQQVDATEEKKWDLIKQSHITHFFESGGKEITDGDKEKVIKLLAMLIPSSTQPTVVS